MTLVCPVHSGWLSLEISTSMTGISTPSTTCAFLGDGETDEVDAVGALSLPISRAERQSQEMMKLYRETGGHRCEQ